MALITVTGYPCAGKSTRGQQLAACLERRLADPSYEGPRLRVSVLSDDTLNIPRSVYDGA
jgi:protein KTI12